MKRMKAQLLFICSFIVQLASAQAIGSNNEIDSTILICEYIFKQNVDTISNEQYHTANFTLEIGHKCSKYYHKNTDKYQRIKSDPKLFALYSAELQQSLIKSSNNILNFKPLSLEEPLVIYNNFPEGYRTIQDVLFTDHYIYTEENTLQEWSITNDTISILGYLCHKAKCNYRGRDYEAWFTLEIPVSKGPWKFAGLPGLILKVQDSENHYSFTVSSIIKSVIPIEYIEYSGRKYTKIDRKKILKMEIKMRSIGLEQYTQMGTLSESPQLSSGANNQNYDLLEKDYR